MENIICTRYGGAAGLKAPHVTDIEFDLVSHIRILGLILVAHVILFLLITGKNADFANICA